MTGLLAAVGFGLLAEPVVYDRPAGTLVPFYACEDARGQLPFYGEYYPQSGDGASPRYDNDEAWYENLEVIGEYATVFDVILREDDEAHLRRYLKLIRAAEAKGLLVYCSAYGEEGVDRFCALLDLLEREPDGQGLIRNLWAVHLGDEPYLAGQATEQVEALVTYFDRRVQTRYPHIRSWINFAISNQDFKTWGAKAEDGRRLLPLGLDIVSIDVYAYVGNGGVEGWGSPDFAASERAALDWLSAMFADESSPWNQTRLLREAIDARYPPTERPMMILIGCSGYVKGITHPTPVSIQDLYFEICREKDWAGLIWWCFEDFKDCIGGRRPEIIEAHRRHGTAIREAVRADAHP